MFFYNANEPSVHTTKINKAFSLGLTVQPYVVVVGSNDHPIISFYTVIDETYYKLETIIKAFDICFKSFHTLNLEYPIEAEQVWTFFQTYFYDIKRSKSEKQILSIKTLTKDLQNYNFK